MSRAYSDHFDPTGAVSALSGTTTFDKTLKVSAGIAHARERVKIAHATVGTAGMTSGDELRLMRFKSTDRIIKLYYASAGASTTYAANLGLYLPGTAGDGAVVDADLFGNALALASGAALTEAFAESTVLADEDRGKTLWELAAVGAATYTEDPKTDFDLVLTSTATGTGAPEVLVVIAEYTSGD